MPLHLRARNFSRLFRHWIGVKLRHLGSGRPSAVKVLKSIARISLYEIIERLSSLGSLTRGDHTEAQDESVSEHTNVPHDHAQNYSLC
jgi:hypothetical protein